MLGVVGVVAHLVHQPVNHMMNRFNLQFACAGKNLILAHQRRGMANLRDGALGVVAHLALQHARAAANLRYRMTGSRIGGGVAQRIHDLVKHALASFHIQLLRG